MFIGPQFQINYTSHLFSKHQLGVYEKTRSPAARGNSSTWTDTWGGSTWERATAGSRQKRKLWRTRRRKELDLNHGTKGRILARMVGGCDCNRPWIRRKKFMPKRSKRKSRKKRMKGRKAEVSSQKRIAIRKPKWLLENENSNKSAIVIKSEPMCQ